MEKKIAFLGNSHIAYWPLHSFFPTWECLNLGHPGEGLDYIRHFRQNLTEFDAVVIQFGSNDLHRLNRDNMADYAAKYVEATEGIFATRKYLYCIFPENDYNDGSTSVNRFIARLNAEIKSRLTQPDIVYLDVFDTLLKDGLLNPDYTIDGLHLSGAGYQIVAGALLKAMEEEQTGKASIPR